MFDHILLPLDGSLVAECVLPHAVALARAFDAQITLVRVLAPPGEENGFRPIDRVDWSVRRQAGEAYLSNVAKGLSGLDLSVRHVLLEGQPAERVVEFTAEDDVNLIVLSSHGSSGLSRWNVGSVGQKILNLTHLSSFIVRAYGAQTRELSGLRYRRVLVALDGSPRAECALSPAQQLVHKHQGELLLAHAIERPAAPRRAPLLQEELELVEELVKRNRHAAEEYLGDISARAPDGTRTKLLVSEDAASCLHECVEDEDVDLVVLCAHGSSGKTRWPFGSLTTSFIQYGDTPLLVVQDLSRDDLEPSRAAIAVEEHKGH